MFQAYRLIDNGDSLMVFRKHLLSFPLSGHYFVKTRCIVHNKKNRKMKIVVRFSPHLTVYKDSFTRKYIARSSSF